MNTVYCTLFDSNYLDKGIVMIRSLQKVDDTAKIYVLCMDDKCKLILEDFKLNSVNLISLNEFLDNDLYKVINRGKAEFCWTCTAKLIKYVMEKYGENICTYIDSDLYFYSNPQVLIREMEEKSCSVQVISHRFLNNTWGRMLAEKSGKNCVQFNTFTKDNDSQKLLDKWISQCLKECSRETVGDQKYTDNWGEFSFVNISKNGGAGIAPWNFIRYKLYNKDKQLVYDKYDKKEYEMIFYHFQDIYYINRYRVRLNIKNQSWIVDNNLFDYVYPPYLIKIEEVKKILEKKYNIELVYSAYDSGMNIKFNLWNKIKELINTPFLLVISKVKFFFLNRIRKKEIILDFEQLVKENNK